MATAMVCFGGWVEMCYQRWWLCQVDETELCLMPETAEGEAPYARLACDSKAELLEYAAQMGLKDAVMVQQYTL